MSTVRSMSARLAFPVVPATVPSGCGLTRPDTYEPDEKDVQADAGEKFTLSVSVPQAKYRATIHTYTVTVRQP